MAALQCAQAVALEGIYCTSMDSHNLLSVTVHYNDEKWELPSPALAVMTTEDTYFTKKHAWNNLFMCTAVGCLMVNSLQLSATGSLQKNVFDLATGRKALGP